MAAERSANTVSTRDLKRVLGFKELMSTAVGQIIGAGIMSLMGIAIGMTGRSVPVAFVIAAFFSVISIIPLVIIAGTVRMRGGQYTMTALLAGKRFTGVFIVLFIASNVAISMYALSFADYFLALFMPPVGRKAVAVACLLLFYAINMLGVDKMAKAQNLIVVVMCVALAMLAVFGIGKLDPEYLSGDLLPGGYKGLMNAAALLTFATGGGFLVVNLSAEAKNATRDIPLTILVSTFGVAVLYAFLAVVAAGVLPVEQVAYKPLSLVAEAVLPRSLYVFFMVCGAMFALISTLNAQLAWATKPILQSCVDGWLPKGLAYLHPRYKTPMFLLTIFMIVGLIPIMTGLDIGSLGQMANIFVQLMFIIVNVTLFRLPRILPLEWGKSKFRVSSLWMWIFIVVSVAGGLLQIWLMSSDLDYSILYGMGALLVVAVAFSFWRYNSGKVDMEISYEAN